MLTNEQINEIKPFDRLTIRREDGRVYTQGQTWSNWEMCVVPCSRGNDRYDIRLAEYEDTGLTPEQVAQLAAEYRKAMEALRNIAEDKPISNIQHGHVVTAYPTVESLQLMAKKALGMEG